MRALVLPDEEKLVVPEVWRATLHARRGGLAGPERPLAPDAVAQYRDWLRSERTTNRLAKTTPPERGVILDQKLLAEGRRYLRGWLDRDDPGDEATPLGAAVAVLLTLLQNRRWDPNAYLAVDAWVTRFGIEFAARAVGELAGLVSGAGSKLWSLDPDATTEQYGSLWLWEDLSSLCFTALGVRLRLATAPDEQYERVCEMLAEYRTSPAQRIITSYLAPTQVAWVDADCVAAAAWPGERNLCGLLLLSASSVRQLEQLRENVTDEFLSYERHDELGTVLDGVGPAAAPVLIEPFYRKLLKLNDPKFSLRERIGPEGTRLLAATPTDEAFRLLCRAMIGAERVRPGSLLKSGALSRFPVRALRILTELESAPLSLHLLEHLQRHDVSNPDEQAMYTDLLGRQLLADPRLPAAAADVLPAAVRDRVQEIVASGGAGLGAGFAGLLDRHYRQRYLNYLENADEEKRLIAALADIPADDAFGRLVDRVDQPYVRPALLTAAKRDPSRALRVLLAKAADGADTVTELLRNHVLTYPDAVAEVLPALDEQARAQLRATAPDSSPTEDAAGATPAILAGPPAGRNGKSLRVPEPPEWLILPALPAAALRDGDESLSPNAVRQLYALLAVSKIAAAHPGIAEVRTLCEPHGLAVFAWTIFEQWRAAQYPPKNNLAMVALALLGDDSIVPALTSLFPGWAKGSSGRVRTGMDVLAAIGSEGALRELYRLARKAKTKGFRQLAAQRLTDAAQARGLSTEQLADRMVPDLGLDGDARMALDYGPRQFTVGFDALFTAYVTDQHGARLARLPRPAAADDEALASAAYRGFTALKKDVQTVAMERVGALEEAMVAGRRWSEPDFQRLFVRHPLMWQLTHRLLWASFDERGEVVTVFRPAEDRTFADLDDKTVELAETATVGIAHPWHFAADRAAWSTVLADYEIIQPFSQVGRELLSLPEDEADQFQLERFVGRTVAGRRLWALAARGWRFGDGHATLLRDWSGDLTVEIGFHGYSFHDPDHEEQLTGVAVSTTNATEQPSATFADLDPIAISEVLRDVNYLVA